VDNTVTDWDAPALGMNVTATRTTLGTPDTPQSGTITVTAAPRKDSDTRMREGYFYVESGNLKGKKIIVRQLGAPLRFHADTVLHFPYNGDTKTVEVTSSYTSAWTIAGSGTDHTSFSYPPSPGVVGNGSFNVSAGQRTLNDEQQPRKRTATLTVSVTTPTPGASGTVTVDQMYAWLKRGPLSNIPCVETIPAVYIDAGGGSNYWLEAITNMKDWNVKMYVTDVDGNKLTQPSTGFGDGTQVNGPITRPATAGNDNATYRANGIVIPPNDGPASRYISFYLYCAEYPGVEVYAFTGEQAAAKPQVNDGDFAGSNVYWDAAKGSLTFDGADDRSNEQYQGVYFRWGSLIGIQPTPWYIAPLDPPVKVYIPDYKSGNNPTWPNPAQKDMNDPEAHTNNTAATDLWPVNNVWKYLYDGPWQAGSSGSGSLWNQSKGDICIYLGAIGKAPKGYRLPTFEELGGDANGIIKYMNTSWNGYYRGLAPWIYDESDKEDKGSIGTSWSAIGTLSGDGKAKIKYGAKTNFGGNAFLPASGNRGNSGNVAGADEPGVRGVYWTSDGIAGSSRYSAARILNFWKSSNSNIELDPNPTGPFYRYRAAPIRCIRDTDLDLK
jgi:hypothetical protein